MKITPVSGDMLLKLALVAGAGLAVYIVARNGIAAASDLPGKLWASISELPGKAYDATADAVRVDRPPLADLGQYSMETEAEWQRREQAAAAGTPVSAWERFKYDITHIFNGGTQ